MNENYAIVLLPSSSHEANTLGIYTSRAKAKQAMRYYNKTSPGRKCLLICLLDQHVAKL